MHALTFNYFHIYIEHCVYTFVTSMDYEVSSQRIIIWIPINDFYIFGKNVMYSKFKVYFAKFGPIVLI